MSAAKMMSITQFEGYSFFIPTYQRGFRWNRQQVKELLNDLYSFVTKKDDRRSIYCLQPIVVRKKSEECFEVIDGQQRLTAIWLLYKLRTIFRGDGPEAIHYSLTFEEKNQYQCLIDAFNKIIEECVSPDEDRKASSLLVRGFNGLKDGTLNTCDDIRFKNIDISQSNEFRDIDSKNFINIVDYLLSDSNDDKSYYFYDESKRNVRLDCKTVINEIFGKIGLNWDKDVQVIWDEMGDDNVIEKFTNVNANKIPLSEAELIKAYLLDKAPEAKRASIAHKWESIERGLQDDSFWSFFVYKTEKYYPRIEALFDIWYASYCKGESKYKDHILSNTAIDFMNDPSGGAVKIWETICEINDILLDWYKNYFFYHVIGLLLILIKSEKMEFVYKIYSVYKDKPKSASKSWLIRQICSVKEIREFFKVKDENDKDVDLSHISEQSIRNRLEELDYEVNNEPIKPILLLYNISFLLNSGNKYEKFPFDLYKTKNTWDIEHVNARSKASSSNYDDGITVEKAREIYDPENKYKDLSEDAFVKEISAKYLINRIGNLVLLDSKTNRSYKDKPFSEKREILIQVMRNEYFDNQDDKKGSNKTVVLPGTRWVFLKEGSSRDIGKWTCGEDYKSYEDNIAKNIHKLIKNYVNDDSIADSLFN